MAPARVLEAAAAAGQILCSEFVLLMARGRGGHEFRPIGLLDLKGLPEPLRSRLVREGYIKVDGPNLLDTDRYVPSEYVRDVSEDRVRLSVPKDRLTKED